MFGTYIVNLVAAGLTAILLKDAKIRGFFPKKLFPDAHKLLV